MSRFQLFVEFFQRVTKLQPTGGQLKVARLLLTEVGEFIARGTGKTTLFDMLEAYADGENADYVTRAELLKTNEELSALITKAEAEIEQLKKALASKKE